MAHTPAQLIGFDSLLSEEERMIRDTVREFCDRELRPHIGDWFEAHDIPRELGPKFGEIGVLGMHLEGYGCAGTSAVAYGLACMELEAVDSGIRSFVSVQGSLAMYAIHKWGDEEQKNRWLPEMAAGRAIGCFGLTEPDFGSNPAGMRTHARRDGDDWVLNGTKTWITNGSLADVAVVWARTDSGFAGFLVEKGTAGFTTSDIHRKVSLRASITSELVLDEVRVPDSSRLPGVGTLRGPLSCLNEARFGIMFGALGSARDSIEQTLEYVRERRVFDKPLSSYQLTQAKLADMVLELDKGLLLALQLGRLKDAGALPNESISLGKLNSTREAIAIARQCRTLLGASGITTEYSPIRHANNLESVLTYEGTAEMHQLIIGQALTGEQAFR
ncbi:acyl-CoA dehydrogenase [Corynebacterium xerosis]|uniref:acyl-CoA dehydrogenase family protein n=1 Tax=Corynebacterium xerosis TaxID=1725 RepID=UPI00062781A9|nr:acyl-CoA dehydrogenase family protein [Corynebacterium xerosis]KKO82667.1 acyl-CoA dehydrogenase [Corynebacterium xerosis]SQB95829.1 acyl-CoA dehydrogenase [Clostridium paraputrificum]